MTPNELLGRAALRRIAAVGCVFALIVGAAQAGCGPSEVGVGATVVAPGPPPIAGPPTMVWLSPGVWVVENYPYPVYYTGGFYWYLSGGVWYRSPHWGRGFHRYPRDRVPVRVRTLPHERYRHYHAARSAPRFRPHQGARPPERPRGGSGYSRGAHGPPRTEHRSYSQRSRREYRGASPEHRSAAPRRHSGSHQRHERRPGRGGSGHRR